MPSLLWLVTIPFVSSVVLFSCRIFSKKQSQRLAVGLSLLPLLLLMYGNNHWIGSTIDLSWMPALDIHFHLTIDSLSLLFLFLSALIIPISLLATDGKDLAMPHVFYGFICLLEGLLIVFFTARDLIVFTIFWEAMLLPLYFIINLWGGDKRETAALKFLIYMIAGSTLMVAAILSLYVTSASNESGTFNLDLLRNISDASPHAPWLCAIFLLAFSVKTPLFPFHAWLPDAYCQAPVAGSILLSALLSKAGIYGILRVLMELFPSLMSSWSSFLLGFAIVGVFYGGFAAWMQTDFKRLLAYSSFAHVNFVLAGLFVWNTLAHEGAIFQALNHGVTITGLFLVAGWLEERIGTTSMGNVSGLAKFFPHLCWLTLFFVLSNVALPGTNNFVGEFLILFGLFVNHPLAATILSLTVVLSVIYMLRWMQRMYFERTRYACENRLDLTGLQMMVAIPIGVIILWMGIYPAPVLEQIVPAAERLSRSSVVEDSQ